MFTNKNKLIGFIALIVVVVLVGSAAIALIADNAVKNAAAELAAQEAAKAEAAAKAPEQPRPDQRTQKMNHFSPAANAAGVFCRFFGHTDSIRSSKGASIWISK